MATKKKTKKKPATMKKTSARSARALKKTAKKKTAPKKKLAPKKSASKKVAMKTKTIIKKKLSAKTARIRRRGVPAENQYVDNERFESQETRARSAGQSGDLQGLSSVEDADSESVDELIEEGNAFEADAVAGVERAGDADEQEVRTHEVPED